MEMLIQHGTTSWKGFTTNLTDLHSAFNDCRMESHLSDPTLWFMELELHRMKIVAAGGQKKSEPEMIAFVFGNAPDEYKVATQSAKVGGLKEFKCSNESLQGFLEARIQE